jgi:hypothetical protein
LKSWTDSIAETGAFGTGFDGRTITLALTLLDAQTADQAYFNA